MNKNQAYSGVLPLYEPERRLAAKKRNTLKYYVKTVVLSALTAAITTALIVSLTPKSSGDEISDEAQPPIYGTAEPGEPDELYTHGNTLNFTPLDCELPADLQEYTYYLCEAYSLDFNFVMAVMCIESQFNPDVISSTNDYGLMQINIINHAWLSDELGIADFTEPYSNIRAGIYILHGLFRKYEDPERVLMSYNMGEYAAGVLWEHGIHSTDYSEKIIAQADSYRNA